MILRFSSNNLIARSDFDADNMKAWLHPAVYQHFRLLQLRLR